MEQNMFLLIICSIFFYTTSTNVFDGPCSSDSNCKCYLGTDNLLVANCSGAGLLNVPHFNSTVRIIDLSKNNITVLSQQGKIPATIKYLNLSRNRLEFFSNGSFKGMINLIWLDISHNLLYYDSKVFDKQLFEDLENLKYLNMKNNSDKSKNVIMYPVTLSKLTSLEELHIDGLQNAKFGREFVSLENLTVLDLSGYQGHCNLKIIHCDLFEYLPHLKYITLSKCNLRSIKSGAFRNLSSLEMLDLSNNYKLTFRMLENITYDIQFTNLSVLSLKKIHCTYGVGTILFDKDTKYLRNSSIKEFYIDSNRLEKVQYQVMQNLPTSLRFLSVRDNKFTIGKYLLFSWSLGNLERLDVSNQYHAHGLSTDSFTDCGDWRGPENTVNAVTNTSHIVQQYSQWPINFDIPFPLPPKLRIADGSSSSFQTTIGRFIFSKNNSLTHVYLQNNSLYYWRGPVRNLHQLEYLDLSYNLCGNVTVDFFNDVPNLKILNISNNNLGFVLNHDNQGKTFENLSSLLHLDLSNNKIFFLPVLTFKNMRNLTTLIMKDNLLKQWVVTMDHMKNLINFDISLNQISILNEQQRNAIDSLVSLHNFTMNLTGNTLRCNCEAIDFLHWMNDIKRIFPNFDQYLCTLFNGSTMPMNNLRISLLKRQCGNYIGLISGALAAVVLCVSIVISGLVYRFRWKLRYLYYVTKSKYKGHSNNFVQHEYEYDAFVSYANEDQAFITELLVEHIENAGGLKLCLHQRDFIAGNDVAENITDAISKSRRTILILSPYYLKSYWCMFEFNMARMESIYTREGENVLFLILYKKVAPRDLPLTLLDLIESKSYLEYTDDEQGQIVFWNKLRESILKE